MPHKRRLRRLSLERLDERCVLDATYHALASGPLLQDWSNTSLISAPNDWSQVPSIVGYAGGGLVSQSGLDPQAITASTTSAQVLQNKTAVLASSNTNSGVAEFHLMDPVVGLAGSGTADAPYLQLHLDSRGVYNVRISFRVRDIDDTNSNTLQRLAVQYRPTAEGAYINVPEGFVEDATSGPTAQKADSLVNVTLPSGANNRLALQVRFITADASNADEWIGIDDIRVEATVNSPPMIVSNGGGDIAHVTVLEGSTAVTTIQASDPDPQPPTFFLPGGADASKFRVNGSTGELSFITPPSVDNPTDADSDGTYEVIVLADDGFGGLDEQTLLITVQRPNAPPAITSSGEFQIPENSTGVGTVAAVDSENDALTYSLISGDDASLFAINAETGALSFVAAPNFENALDSGADNIYQLRIAVTDNVNPPVTQDISVTVLDENEAPTQLTLAGDTVPENSPLDTVIGVLSAIDEDLNDSHSFELLNNAGGRFQLVGSELRVADGAALDYESSTSHTIEVRATDAEGVSLDQVLTVAVTGVNERPSITISSLANSYWENYRPKRIIAGGILADPEDTIFSGGSLQVQIVSGADPNDQLGIFVSPIGPSTIEVIGNELSFAGTSFATLNRTESRHDKLVIDFENNASFAAVQALIQHITFQSLGERPTVHNREIAFEITDSGGATNETTIKTMTVHARPDRPRLGMGGARAYYEDQKAVPIVHRGLVFDSDSDHFLGGSLSIVITSGGESSDQLSILTQGKVSTSGDTVLYNGNTIGTLLHGESPKSLTISFTTTDATREAVEAVVQAIGFSNSNDPAATPRVVEFRVNDGDAESLPRTRTINVVPVNDRPGIRGGGGTALYNRNGLYANLLPISTLQDDQPNLAGARLVVSLSESGEATDHSSDRMFFGPGFEVDSATNQLYFGAVSGGVVIGTINDSGGIGTTNLVIDFNANANLEITGQLLRALRFRTVGALEEANGTRLATVLFTDSLGRESNVVVKTIVVRNRAI